MAEITFTVPNSQVKRMVDAMCTAGGYAGDPSDQAARREFARDMVREYVRRTVLQVERENAAAEAMASVVVNPITVE